MGSSDNNVFPKLRGVIMVHVVACVLVPNAMCFFPERTLICQQDLNYYTHRSMPVVTLDTRIYIKCYVTEQTTRLNSHIWQC